MYMRMHDVFCAEGLVAEMKKGRTSKERAFSRVLLDGWLTRTVCSGGYLVWSMEFG